ncbi:amidohydrolase [candidate division KSB1 bacterium]
MKRTMLLWILIPAVLLVLSCDSRSKDYADLVLINGNIYTVSEDNPREQAVAVKDGRIQAVGSDKHIDALRGPDTILLDVQGKLVIPGFIDAHCHFASGGKSLADLDLRQVNSIDEIKQKITAKIKELPEGAPVFGRGSFPNTSLFPGLGWPTKEILDEVSPDNPVVIRRGGGHAVWINTRALQQSGIIKESAAPYGGEIVKNPDTGEPTGILKEAAQSLVRIRGGSTPKEDIERALIHSAKLGLTGICTSSSLNEIEIFRELDKIGTLTLRVNAWLPVSGIDNYIEKGIKQGQGDEKVKIGFLKIFIDGTIGVRSALMFESFSEEPGNTGLAQFEEEEFYARIEKAHKNGYQTGTHAIGDKGVNWVLNAIERAQKKHGKKGLRHRVEHNTVNLVSDTKRFQELEVVASMQPNITGGQDYRERRLGKERARRVDMWRTLIENNTMLAWGTDWPVSTINPMHNLYQIVTRYPEQRLTMDEAIKYYTYGSAYACFEEDLKGTLEVGKLADMVVLSNDLFTIDPQEILNTEVLYTILGGEIVYHK